MNRRTLTLLIAAASVAVLIVIGSFLPVPYVIWQPGPVTDTLGTTPGGTQPLIQVTGHPTYPTTGKLELTTVLVDGGPGNQPSLFAALGDWLDRQTAVVPQQLVFPPGQTSQQVEQQNAAEMQQSQENAITAALRYLHLPVTVEVTVDSVEPGTPAASALKPGDVVVSVDGTAVTGADQLRSLIEKHPVGGTVRLGVRRGQRTFTETVKTIASSQAAHTAIVGFVPKVVHHFPFKVTIGLKDVGGPSAGMMFALGIVDKLTKESLTGGRIIAGTGTITDSGQVGPIGGIQQKVVAAGRSGATVFLAPAGECSDAKKLAPAGVRLVKVSTLADAVQALQALQQGKAVPSC